MRAITLSRPQTNTEPALNYSWIISRYNLDVFLDFGREAIQELVIKYTKTLRDDPDKKYKRSTVHNRIAPIPRNHGSNHILMIYPFHNPKKLYHLIH
jgi:hypothetical protein